jgi:hypothetical protein
MIPPKEQIACKKVSEAKENLDVASIERDEAEKQSTLT